MSLRRILVWYFILQQPLGAYENSCKLPVDT